MLTKGQIETIRNTKPTTVQDYLILELLNEIDEAKRIFRDMQKSKDMHNPPIYRFQMNNRIKEAEEFLKKYDVE